MRVHLFRFTIAALVVSAAWGQAPAAPAAEKVFHFAHINTDKGFQQINYAIRAMTNISQASLDPQAKTLTVRGTASQISMSEWLFRWLDRPAGAPPAEAKLEYAVPGASDDLVRFLYLTNSPTPQDVQEIINAVRSVIEVQRIMACESRGPLVLRGTAAQIATAEWLAQALDKPTDAGPFATISQTLTGPEFFIRGASVNVARVIYPAHLTTALQLQESVNMIRSLAEIQRAVAYIRIRAIIVRADADQVALAEWLLNALAKPPIEEAPVLKGPFNSLVTRMFYLKHAATPQALQEITSLIRTQAKLQRVATYGAQAIAVRGTLDQIAAAERLIKEMDAIIAP